MELIGFGARGDAVRDVQHRLLGAGMRIDAMELDGTFGRSTEAAVREFQRARGLPADGIVGSDTWEQLVEAGYRLGDRTLYLRSPAFRGDDVRELQRMLNALGFDAGKQDGIFGPRTTGGVREFQRNVATKVDGIVGLDTVREIARYRPEGTSRAFVREQEAALGPGFTLAGAVVALDADQTDHDPDDLSLVVVQTVAEELRRLGVRPMLLRERSDPIAVGDRVRRANASEAAILVSVALGPSEPAPSRVVCFHYGTPNTHSPMGRRLASSIHEAIVGRIDAQGDGVDPRSISLLRETRMPAVRIEATVSIGSPTVAVDRTAFATRLGEAIVRGIEAFTQPAAADLARSS
ncbi:MAG TPA: peptidoglycan-binding protein [Actinomycetota bacterium]|nr:peptidoglycan-binding protein [Actinomycetota bacterium]